MSKTQFLNSNSSINDVLTLAYISLILRLGIASVFITGGWNKLSQLIDPERQQALVDSYMGPAGYVNTFFTEYLFSQGGVLSPWLFLTSLSAFELVSGIMILVGFLIRPLALFYGFLLWTFVFSLPVVTTPGVEVSEKTYLAPALLVQIRDVALSGVMFVIYNLGSGAHSIDQRVFGKDAVTPYVKWENLGLLLRLSLASILLVAGFFHGMANIKTFDIPAVLLIVAGFALLLEERAARIAGAALVIFMIVYMVGKLNFDKSLIANLNAIKREFAFIAGGLVLSLFGGGALYTMPKLYERVSESLSIAKKRLQKGLPQEV
ncbi:MAG: DoxX family protein [Pseudomonadota bacterium]